MRAKYLLLASIVVFSATAAQAQYPFKVLHAFGIGNDGAGLWSSVVLDAQGTLYGTTSGGGAYGNGTVFEITPQANDEWRETILYSFPFPHDDGEGPFGGVILDPSGNLYGTTQFGGGYDAGVAFRLMPDSRGPWTESVIHNFGSPGDPACCPRGSLALGRENSLYGTGYVAFALSPVPDGWIETVLHYFTGLDGDGFDPYADPILDSAGNLYGTTQYGGGNPKCINHGCGTVYELQLTAEGPAIWKERILHRFGYAPNDGFDPGSGQLAMDHEGSLYGTAGGGTYHAGIVYKLTPVP